jgi:hypothetical protein
MLQGSTMIVLPWTDSGPVVKVVAVIVKWQEPNVVVPVAVAPPEAIENAGVA